MSVFDRVDFREGAKKKIKIKKGRERRKERREARHTWLREGYPQIPLQLGTFKGITSWILHIGIIPILNL